MRIQIVTARLTAGVLGVDILIRRYFAHLCGGYADMWPLVV